MTKGMVGLSKSMKWTIGAIAIYWLLLVFLDLLGNAGNYLYPLQFFQYGDFLFLVLVGGIGLGLYFAEKPLKWNALTISGFRNVYLYLMVLVTTAVFIQLYLSKNDLDAGLVGFLYKSLGIHFGVFLFVLSAWSAGRFIAVRLPLSTSKNAAAIIHVALGFAVMSIGVFFLGLFKVINVFTVLAWLLLLLISGGKGFAVTVKEWVWDKKTSFTLSYLSVFLLLAALVVLSINLVAAISPYPIGFDSLTVYMNIPSLISEYGSLVEGFQPHYWSLITSLGYVVFDSNSIAQYLGVLPGILSIFVVYRIARYFVGIDWSIFAAVIFYLIPVIVWQSSIEIKTDLGLLFILLTAVLMVVDHYRGKTLDVFPIGDKNPLSKGDLILWGTVGALFGFALGIKLTAFITILSLVVFLFYIYSGRYLASAAFFAAIAVVFGMELYGFANLDISTIEKYVFIASTGAVSIVLFVWAVLKKRESLLKPFKLSVVLMLFAGIVFSPWVGKNIAEHGAISISSLINSKDPTFELLGSHPGLNQRDQMPRPMLMNSWEESEWVNSEPSVTFVVSEEGPTGKQEEINRYLGYEGGAMRFLTLPYDLSMQANVSLFATHIGVIFLGFFPLILLFFRREGLAPFILKLAFILLWMSFSVWSVHNTDNVLSYSEVMNSLSSYNYGKGSAFFDSLQPIYLLLMSPLVFLASLLSPLYALLTYDSDAWSLGFVILSSVLLYYLFRGQFRKQKPLMRGLMIFGGCYFIFWLMLSSGIPWYGILGLALMPVLLAKLYFSNQDSPYKWIPWVRYFSLGFLIAWVLLLVFFRLTPLAVTDVPDPAQLDYKKPLSPSSVLYACNSIDRDQWLMRFYNPPTVEIIDQLNRDSEAKVLNVGTSLNFFIRGNDRRLYEDNQLDFFNAIWSASRKSMVVTTNRLKLAGIDYILLDLDVATLDVTPDQSLLRKVEELVEYLHNNPHIELIATDRLVVHPRGDRQMTIDGSNVLVKNHIFGNQIIEPGKRALFKVK